MQWMSDRQPRRTSALSTAASGGSSETFVLTVVAGTITGAIGIAIAITGGTPAAAAAGWITASVGFVASQVGTIALGVFWAMREHDHR
jgi:hypothetical protein